MILGAILNPINSSIIAVALVPIGIALGAPASETAWLVSGLYLATAVGQPVVGRLVDLYGPRRLYLAGTAARRGRRPARRAGPRARRARRSPGCCSGSAPAPAIPAAMYLIRGEARRTGRDSPAGILTVLAVSTQTIAVIGPTLGGLLIGLGGWRATFTVNVPLALACLVLGALAAAPRPPRRAQPRRDRRARSTPPASRCSPSRSWRCCCSCVHRTGGLWFLPVLAVAAGRRARCGGSCVRAPRSSTCGCSAATSRCSRPTPARCWPRPSSYALLYGFTQWLEEGRGLAPRRRRAGPAAAVRAPGIVVSTLTGRRPEIRGKLLVGAAAQVVLAGCCCLLRRRERDLVPRRGRPGRRASRRA